MDEVLAGKLENISERTAEELSALKDGLVSEFQGIDTDNLTPETVEQMESLNEAMNALRSEESRRETEAKELAARAQEASDVFNTGTDEGDDENAEVTDEDVAATDIVDEEEIVDDEVAADVAEDVEAVADDVAEVVADEVDNTEEVVEETADEDKDEEEEVNTDFASKTENDSEEETSDEDKELSAEAPAEAELANEDKTEDEDSKDEDASELSVEATTESEEVTVNTEFSAPDQNTPAVTDVASVVKTPVIIAAADVRGLQSGSVIPTPRALGQAILDRRKSMDRTYGGDGEQALVASIVTSDWYDDSRTLASGDTEGNRNKVETIVASLQSPDAALVAAGGLYGPVDTSWDIYELGETLGRPVKDSLPAFKADRGGLRFMTPPALADLAGAVSVWTMEDDIEAADPLSDKEKPCIRVNAGTEVTVYLEAQPLCLTFGNMGARAYPELVERHISLAMVHQARFAESRLLKRIGDLSVPVTAAAQLGAARDLLVQLDQATAAMRNRHRLDPEAPLRAIFPVWFKNALRADLVKQLPGDGQDAALSLADATIDSWFAERKVSVTWALDSISSQYFAEQTAGALVAFPANVVWYLFPEGTFLFLEEANLDLGIVRDSTLNATNDYKMFVETFENVAKVGVESLVVTSALKIAGASAGTVNTLA